MLPNGEVFTIEFLLDEPSFQPHHAPYIKNLGTLGIEASLRMVDPVQFRARLEDFDFDMTVQRFSMSATRATACARSFRRRRPGPRAPTILPALPIPPSTR